MATQTVMGTEIEYGITVTNDPDFDPISSCVLLVNAYREDPAAHEELLSSREEEESFRPLLVGYLTRMRDSLTDLAEITRTRARREATVFAHKLRGTARSYGYPRIGAHAGALEELLRDPHTPDQDWLSSMTALAGLMRAATARLATLQGDPDGTAA